MQLGTTNMYLRKTQEGKLLFNDGSGDREITDPHDMLVLNKIYSVFMRKVLSDGQKMTYLNDHIKDLNSHINNTSQIDSSEEKVSKFAIMKQLDRLINFFSEFSFEPNYRFVNTFAYACANGSHTQYVSRYFELTGSQYTKPVEEKMKSQEFIELCEFFKKAKPSQRINKRFKLYYGSAGTGKTTKAMEEASNNCMTCHSAMLPSDLMEDFKFVDGKAEFTPSALQIAMTTGKSIVLDEINLLPFESLRFLQTILDGKKEFIYKGKTIHIVDGFKVIGTMNLIVNGCTYNLPEPLVDRAEELCKYQLKAADLVSAVM